MDQALPTPPLNPETSVFNAAATEGRLLLRRCTACGKPNWYPRAVCPFCFGETVWETASGQGVIYSYSVMRRVAQPFAIAYVTLAEGPVMMTNLVDCDLNGLRIGQPVTVVFKPTAGGPLVPCFRTVL